MNTTNANKSVSGKIELGAFRALSVECDALSRQPGRSARRRDADHQFFTEAGTEGAGFGRRNSSSSRWQIAPCQTRLARRYSLRDRRVPGDAWRRTDHCSWTETLGYDLHVSSHEHSDQSSRTTKPNFGSGALFMSQFSVPLYEKRTDLTAMWIYSLTSHQISQKIFLHTREWLLISKRLLMGGWGRSTMAQALPHVLPSAEAQAVYAF